MKSAKTILGVSPGRVYRWFQEPDQWVCGKNWRKVPGPLMYLESVGEREAK